VGRTRPETESSGDLAFDLQRVLPAVPERVWRALTEPAELSQWWGPAGFTSPGMDFNPRVGGGYRITMQPPAGDAFYLSGEFLEVDPPVRLAYTFVWDPPDPDDRETVARLSLRDHQGSTEVSLTQSGFLTEDRVALHRDGWTESFERLAKLLSGDR
jgi:uncharacterized protein YndB with AHSA1/START domain